MLFDEEFLEVYRHGIVIMCCDGIKRCFYLQIFTYSADYPKKYRSASNLCPVLFLTMIFTSVHQGFDSINM